MVPFGVPPGLYWLRGLGLAAAILLAYVNAASYSLELTSLGVQHVIWGFFALALGLVWAADASLKVHALRTRKPRGGDRVQLAGKALLIFLLAAVALAIAGLFWSGFFLFWFS